MALSSYPFHNFPKARFKLRSSRFKGEYSNCYVSRPRLRHCLLGCQLVIQKTTVEFLLVQRESHVFAEEHSKEMQIPLHTKNSFVCRTQKYLTIVILFCTGTRWAGSERRIKSTKSRSDSKWEGSMILLFLNFLLSHVLFLTRLMLQCTEKINSFLNLT